MDISIKILIKSDGATSRRVGGLAMNSSCFDFVSQEAILLIITVNICFVKTQKPPLISVLEIN